MKIKIKFKDPDGVSESIELAAKEFVNGYRGFTKDERQLLEKSHGKIIGKALEPWIGCGEYLTVEFDTEAKTATVLSTNGAE